MPILSFADAILVAMTASEKDSSTYLSRVMLNKPVLFLRCSDRKGSRLCVNKGTLGLDFNGKYTLGCGLEEAGPIPSDPFTRAVLLHPNRVSRIDVKVGDVM